MLAAEGKLSAEAVWWFIHKYTPRPAPSATTTATTVPCGHNLILFINSPSRKPINFLPTSVLASPPACSSASAPEPLAPVVPKLQFDGARNAMLIAGWPRRRLFVYTHSVPHW